LRAHKLRVIDRNGQVVDPKTIRWSAYTGTNFPYRLEQEPGPGNALGRVKFMFPNNYAVYLHDTPRQQLFGGSARAFSSGCIRVENPLNLAALLLDEHKEWNRASIDKVVDSGKTLTVNLKKPTPVLLLYWTAAVAADGQVQFMPDVYGRDPAVLKALKGPFSYRKRPIMVTASR